MRARECRESFGGAMAVRGDHRVSVKDLEPEVAGLPFRPASQRLRHLDRLAEMRDRFLEGRAAQREIARLAPIFNRGLS